VCCYGERRAAFGPKTSQGAETKGKESYNRAKSDAHAYKKYREGVLRAIESEREREEGGPAAPESRAGERSI
jgi:hypothetical protein